MDDLEFIKKFSKISIKQIAKENGISTSNLYSGRCGSRKTYIMRKAIEAKIAELYIEDYNQVKEN
jgi:predicted DNA-binding protein